MDKHERFIASYLRLNADHTVTNFIAHDPTHTSGTLVGNYTDADILGIRMPYSREVVGPMPIQNHEALTDGAVGKFDVVIAEVKSGRSCKPNGVWRNGVIPAIEYMIRFIGLFEDIHIATVAQSLASAFQYEDSKVRLRYIIFAPEENSSYAKKGVTYIPLREVIEFIVQVRGNCWIDNYLGTASLHSQWDEVMIEVFKIANTNLPVSHRVAEIESYLTDRR